MKTEILNQWKQRHIEKHQKKYKDTNVNFIYDGIVDFEEWTKSSTKACFFLKEAYMKEVYEEADLCERLNKKSYIVKMWHVVADWIYALQNVSSGSIPSYNHIDSHELARIKTSAVVNIKEKQWRSEFKSC